MKAIISDKQFDEYVTNSQLHKENEIFAQKYYEKYGRLPYAKTLESQRDVKVGEIYPEHPNSGVNLKTFYQLYFKNINEVNSKLEEKYSIKSKFYVSIDGKYRFKSLFECVLYNIFYYENHANELVYESRDFFRDCQKIPDFLWKTRNILIEVAGMESEKYYEKLSSGKSCLENKGYEVIILEVRNLQKSHKYLEFYELVCKTFNFPIREDILNFPSKIIDYKSVDRKFMQDYIDKFINIFDRKRGETDMLVKYLKMLGFEGINDYKTKKGLGKYQKSYTVQQVLDVFNSGRAKTYDEAAKILNVSRSTIDNKMSLAKKLGLISTGTFGSKESALKKRKVLNRPSYEQILKDLNDLKSYNAVAKKYNVTHGAIKKWIKQYSQSI